MPSFPGRLVPACSLLLAIACAGPAASVPDSAPAPDAPVRSPLSPNVITQAELENPALGDVDLVTAIKRLRPRFLNYRGMASANSPDAGTTQLSVDGMRLQPIEGLSALRTTEVVEIRYLNATDASQQFGTMSRAGPVIVLRRK